MIKASGVVTSLGDGGSIDNAGLINSSYGVRLAATGTVTNEGTILTTGTFPPSYGVYAKHGGTVTNGAIGNSTAQIEGYTGIRFVPGVGSSYYGFVSNFGTVIGHGTIYSGISIGQGGTVTNGASSDSAALIQGGRWGVYVPAAPSPITAPSAPPMPAMPRPASISAAGPLISAISAAMR